MKCRRQDVAIVAKYLEAMFSLTGEKELEGIEGVDMFKYLQRLLERSDGDWTASLRNIRKARQMWGRIGKLLRMEGVEPTVSEKFYHVVVQTLLLFGAETWVLTETM